MHDYIDNDAFPNPVRVIDDTDPPNASNLMTAPEGTLDRTRFLYNRLISQGVYKLVAREQQDYMGAKIDVVAATKTVSDPGNRNHTTNFAVALLTMTTAWVVSPGDLFLIGYRVPFFSSGAVGVDPVVGVGFSITGSGVQYYPDVMLSNECQTNPDVDRGGRDQGGNLISGAASHYSFTKSHLGGQEVIGNQKIVLALGQTVGAAANYFVLQGMSFSVAQYRQVVP